MGAYTQGAYMCILGIFQYLRIQGNNLIKRFSIAITANGKHQAEIFSLMKNHETFLV